MSDKEKKCVIVDMTDKLEGQDWWCDRPGLISIPGRPELSLFPDMLTWHYGNSRVARPYVKTVTYFPWFLSLRFSADGREYHMNYQSIHDPGSWLVFKAAADGSLWQAERFRRGECLGETVAPPGLQFFILLAHQGIAEGEKCFARDWPEDEIAAIRESSLSPVVIPDNIPKRDDKTDVPWLLSRLTDEAESYFGVSRAEATLMLIEILRYEVAKERPPSRPN